MAVIKISIARPGDRLIKEEIVDLQRCPHYGVYVPDGSSIIILDEVSFQGRRKQVLEENPATLRTIASDMEKEREVCLNALALLKDLTSTGVDIETASSRIALILGRAYEIGLLEDTP